MNEGLVPCGLNLQADVVTLRNGLSSILSLARQGTHISKDEDLKDILKQIVEEVKSTIIDEELSRAFIPTKTQGGYKPKHNKIEWEK